MIKIDQKVLDQIAELEIAALLEGLHNPELRTQPQFLDKVRKFLKDNRLVVDPKAPGASKVIEDGVPALLEMEPTEVN